MNAVAKNIRRHVCLALLLVLPLSAGLARLAAADDMDEDMCSGEMKWMVGWCLDGISGEPSFAAFASALSTTSSAYAGPIEPIDVPGAVGTRAFGINPRGDVVGSYTNATGTHGYVRSGGEITTIDYPGASSTEAWGINARGDIIGRYTIANVAGTRGFLLSRGTYTDVSMRKPDGTYHLITLPTKIGASGEIVGCFHDASSLTDMYGYVHRGSSVTAFALPTVTAPTGSSAMHNGVMPGGGVVVGFTFPTATTARGYVVTRDTLTFVDFPGSTNTQLWDVNPAGTMVGQYFGSGRTNGLYVDAEGYHTINVPASTMTVARGINPQGDIVGVYNDASGAHGFVLRR
jgi:uncharacterized membrane protein